MTQGVTALAAEKEKRSLYNKRYVCHKAPLRCVETARGGLREVAAVHRRAVVGPAKEHLGAKIH